MGSHLKQKGAQMLGFLNPRGQLYFLEKLAADCEKGGYDPMHVLQERPLQWFCKKNGKTLFNSWSIKKSKTDISRHLRTASHNI